jgi:hypothetical protein
VRQAAPVRTGSRTSTYRYGGTNSQEGVPRTVLAGGKKPQSVRPPPRPREPQPGSALDVDELLDDALAFGDPRLVDAALRALVPFETIDRAGVDAVRVELEFARLEFALKVRR